MTLEDLEMVLRLVVALAAGGLIGYERTFQGRPAGFRTHALVCTASSLLMLVTVYEAHWVTAIDEITRLDPTRMGQGIMTGIGFLGAGVIVKEGATIRGLTTAASIWITAAIGILAGIGFYLPVAAAVLITIGVLSVFNWIQARMPTKIYYHFEVRFEHPTVMTEKALCSLVENHGFKVGNFSYLLSEKAPMFRYRMVLNTTNRSNASRLSDTLAAIEAVREYRILVASD